MKQKRNEYHREKNELLIKIMTEKPCRDFLFQPIRSFYCHICSFQLDTFHIVPSLFYNLILFFYFLLIFILFYFILFNSFFQLFIFYFLLLIYKLQEVTKLIENFKRSIGRTVSKGFLLN